MRTRFAVSFGGWNFRFETEVMEDVCAEFIKQLNTKTIGMNNKYMYEVSKRNILTI